jgi:translocation and assembly module TamA
MSRWAWLLVVVAGCGAKLRGQRPTDPVSRFDGLAICRVAVDGNDAVDGTDIVAGLATRAPSGWLFKSLYRFDPATAQIDGDRIERYYERRGFYAASVVDIEVNPCDQGVEVVFQVEEGQPSIVSKLSFRGTGASLSSADARALAPGVERGEVFIHERYLEAKRGIEGELRSRGYPSAEVDGSVVVDRNMRTVEVAFTIEPGVLAHVGETRIRGATTIPHSAVRNRIEWRRGDRYDPQLIEHTRSALYGLGRFASVRIDVGEPGADGATDIAIEVREGHRKELRFGVGAAADNSNWEARGRAGYTRKGVFDPLLVFDAELRPAYTVSRSTNQFEPGGEARVSLRRPDLVVPLLESSLQAWYDVTRLEAYDSRGPGLGLNLGRPFFQRALRLGAGWRYRWLDFFSIHPAIGPEVATEIGLVEPYRLGYFDQVVVLDGRDELLDPRNGYYAEMRAEQGGAYAGGAFDYARLTGEVRGYVAPAPRWVLAARATLGSAVSGSLPVTQRYFSGGSSSHRGFGQRQLAPSVRDADAGEAPIGGDALLETSFEVRLDVRRLWGAWLGVVVFADGGDVTEAFDDLDPSNLHWAPGIGLRYHTVVGPLRLDFGYRANRTALPNPQAGNRLAFHLSIGQSF